MNCPSRTDEDSDHPGWNQNPPALAADTTTCEDLNGIANTRLLRDGSKVSGSEEEAISDSDSSDHEPSPAAKLAKLGEVGQKDTPGSAKGYAIPASPIVNRSPEDAPTEREEDKRSRKLDGPQGLLTSIGRVLTKFGKFVGPGFMISVAYIDPGNYSTDVAAGASYKFRLLFIVLLSNLFAIFLQSLCVKLGTVTGLNLAEHCRVHLPRWLNIALYLLAESAIIATDIAEVIGSAIALNLLLHIPLVAGCALTLVDVLIILLFYNPSGSMRRLRAFEFFVMALVIGVVVCFCIQLSLIQNTSVGEVFRGYLPSSSIVQSDGGVVSLYLSCGILGATVMPHSLYLGSGMVQSRLRHFDKQAGNFSTHCDDPEDFLIYKPSLAAVRSCLSYSVAELAIALFSFALFVNSAILIVAGVSLSDSSTAQSADLFGIYHLLSESIAPVAATIFALALLLSGTSAGIVCTIAGQMVSEGALNWTVAPWLRRLLTRSISITPSIIIAAAVGKDGLSAALNGTQVALSVILPFVSAPLIYFTCRDRYMTIATLDGSENDDDIGIGATPQGVRMRNNWLTATLAVLIWLIIVIMNVALLVLVGLRKA
ncbi:MAG: hypothetical protein M1812_004923 [Candelaria pacifica]|nr:MAG: hypothetical protein M1812_004923 [Candelaria pacifica]